MKNEPEAGGSKNVNYQVDLFRGKFHSKSVNYPSSSTLADIRRSSSLSSPVCSAQDLRRATPEKVCSTSAVLEIVSEIGWPDIDILTETHHSYSFQFSLIRSSATTWTSLLELTKLNLSVSLTLSHRSGFAN